MKQKTILSKLLLETRSLLGLNQDDFAKKLGLGRRMYGEYERGNYDDSEGDIRRIQLLRMVDAVKKEYEDKIKALDEMPFAQTSDIGKRISSLEAKVSDLTDTVLKLVNKVGL